MNREMPEPFPEFDSDEEMREWFDSADLSSYRLDQALEAVIAPRIELSVGDDPETSGRSSQGASGTLREPVRLVRA